MEKGANFTQFEQKNTHISGCKIVHLCIIATVTMHVAYALNILLVFSLSRRCSHSHSHLTLSFSLLSPHLTPPFPHLLSLSPLSLFLMPLLPPIIKPSLSPLSLFLIPPLPPIKPCLHCRRSSNPHSPFSSFDQII